MTETLDRHTNTDTDTHKHICSIFVFIQSKFRDIFIKLEPFFKIDIFVAPYIQNVLISLMIGIYLL